MSEKFEHYYVEKPSSPLKVRKVRLVLRNGHEYFFKSPSGVYAFGFVDRATRVLLEYIKVHGKTLLDLGCGYGVVGIVVKKEYPDVEVFMSDINERAVEFAKVNVKDNNVEIEVRQGDLYNPWKDMRFDQIISNPPIVAGKRVWMKLVEEALNHLNPEGSLQLVAYHNKGGRRIRDYMKEVFGNVEELCKSGGIRVYISYRRS